MVDSGPCACGAGEVRFAAHCDPCAWNGVHRLTVSEAAEDCMKHNRRQRHRPASATYASLQLTHAHAGAAPGTQENAHDARP